MPCYTPNYGYKQFNSLTSKNFIKFCSYDTYKLHKSVNDNFIVLPCYKCIGCRLGRSREWAARCVHESSLYQDNCFITLTYDDLHLPSNYSLDMKHLQDFWKRLRYYYGDKIRFYAAGEYGEKTGRPHYHACVFNFDFKDKVLVSNRRGNNIFLSQSLRDIWGKGNVSIGSLTFQSAAYTARYIMKKQYSSIDEFKHVVNDENVPKLIRVSKKVDLDEHYSFVDVSTGELVKRRPEFTVMSRRPGIGREWYERYKKDCYPSDFLIVNGSKCAVPKYYDKIFALEEPGLFELIKDVRRSNAKRLDSENTPERLMVKHQSKLDKISRLSRELD
nr:MAG: replication initiator protein [Microvirus sp.]